VQRFAAAPWNAAIEILSDLTASSSGGRSMAVLANIVLVVGKGKKPPSSEQIDCLSLLAFPVPDY
jgi:hypothetical protein